MENNNSEETRKVSIMIDKTNEFIEFQSKATTIGELKRELDALGVNYKGCSFIEALSYAIYDIDDAVLPPEVVSQNGDKTRDLAFLLATRNKKIESGRSSSSVYLDRKKAVGLIKSNNLEGKFKDKYSKCPSNAKTDDLYEFLVENGLDSEIEIEKLDKFGNRIKNSKQANKVKVAIEKKEAVTVANDSIIKEADDNTEEVPEAENIVEEKQDEELPAGGVTDCRPSCEQDKFVQAKPCETLERKCDDIELRIGKAVFSIFKQDATKEDLIELIESQSEDVQREIMDSLTSRLKEKQTYSAEFMLSRMSKFKKMGK